MKTKTLRIILAGAGAVSTLLTGCYTAKYTYQDAPPTPVQFESMTDEQTFYNAVLAKYFPAFADRSKHDAYSAALGLPVEYAHDIRQSSNVIFNEAVAVADANHDGTITEAEAATYAAAIAARTNKQKEDDAGSTGW